MPSGSSRIKLWLMYKLLVRGVGVSWNLQLTSHFKRTKYRHCPWRRGHARFCQASYIPPHASEERQWKFWFGGNSDFWTGTARTTPGLLPRSLSSHLRVVGKVESCLWVLILPLKVGLVGNLMECDSVSWGFAIVKEEEGSVESPKGFEFCLTSVLQG